MFRYAVVLALTAVVLSGCTNDGDRAAAEAAALAQGIADRFDTAFDHPRDAEYLASEIVLDDGTRQVEMLDWAGESAGEASQSGAGASP